jgi:tetratricopeptide (TPR) repeat protein
VRDHFIALTCGTALLANTSSDPVGTLATALAHATRLLATNPSMAAAQAQEILKVMPGQPQALLLLGRAFQKQGDASGAITAFEALTKSQPGLADAQYELGLASAVAGKLDPAIAALKRALRLDPNHIDAWRALGDALALAGDDEGSADAYAQQIKASVRDPQLLEAAAALCDGKLAAAERALRDFLKKNPTDPAAIRMLAETGARLGRLEDAENLLARCLELAPSFSAARHNYALILHRRAKSEEALREVNLLLKEDPRNPNYRVLKPAILVGLGDHRQAIECYESLLAEHSRQPKSWMSYGHALKTVGRQEESIAAYRKSIALLASLGETWWSLANLKTVHFSEADIAEIRTQLKKPKLDEEDRFHLHFALGKALEDEGAYAESFAHYEKGNALRRTLIRYDASDTTMQTERSIALFTSPFFAARKSVGCPSPDPIFVIGLPRAGSTLIEQILSSHSAVEGTMELPDIVAIARRVGGKRKKLPNSEYPEALSNLDRDEFRTLGEEYLSRVRVHRRNKKPFFVDKMPNNFQHVGLIHLILPNAKIIDARRHPLGCCFSNFKQHFAHGQTFTYDLADIGRYYRDYVRLMAHFDAVLPGHMHRVFHENMVADTEREIRALLDYCGLPFEESCLRFYETERAVRTASSEQVRMPIFTEGVDQWRHFEPWLGPLKDALGLVLESYPSVPHFEATNP